MAAKELNEMQPQCEDYLRGRHAFQAKNALQYAKVRHYLAAHPEGVTSDQLNQALGPKSSYGLQALKQRKLARFKRTVQGEPVRWFAVPMEAIT